MRFFHVHSVTRSALSATFAYDVNDDGTVSFAIATARVSKDSKDVATRKMGTDIAAGRLAKGVCEVTETKVGKTINWREVEAMVLEKALKSDKLKLSSRVRRDIRTRLDSAIRDERDPNSWR